MGGVYKLCMGVMEHKNYDFSHYNESKSFGDQKNSRTLGEGDSLALAEHTDERKDEGGVNKVQLHANDVLDL